MQNLPKDIFKQIQNAICRQEGTFTFNYNSPDLFNEKIKGGIILEIPSGEHLFRLERDDNLNLHFYHSSPGTGTRVATINLKEIKKVENLFIAFSWSPEIINFHIGTRIKNEKLISSSGVISEKQFRVGKDGHVYQIGDKGIEVMGVNFYHGETAILQPTALEAWNETIKAIEILSTGQSTEGNLYESILTNSILTILVTGFEAYTKKRFLELEQEGIIPDVDKIINVFYPKKEREIGIAQTLKEEAKNINISTLQYIIKRNIINFQSFEKCKIAYNKSYNIKFGELDLRSKTLQDIQKFIKYRHKIIHVSATLGILNQEKLGVEEPVFPNKDLASKAKEYFVEFIDKLHISTLNIHKA